MSATDYRWPAAPADQGPGVWWLRWLLCTLLMALSGAAQAEPVSGEGDITLQSRFWIDTTGQASVDDVVASPERFEDMAHDRSFSLGPSAALWIQVRPAALDPARRWYLLLTASAFTNQAHLYARDSTGAWVVQRSGDHLPVASWDHRTRPRCLRSMRPRRDRCGCGSSTPRHPPARDCTC